jgi:very-short-patch-repair endonuclease
VARVRVERVLERLGGVASTAELRLHVSWPRIRVATRRGRIVRDGWGRYSLPGADEDRRAANRLTGVLCLQSAARQHGWKVKLQPDEPVIAVPRNRKLAPERRSGVRILYVDLPVEHVHGIVTSPAYTVLQCAARLPFDEALAIADSACRAGDVNSTQLVALAQTMPLRYRQRCLDVARAADGQAANPFESVARATSLDVPGLRLRPQVWIDSIGRCDLGDAGLRLAVECESFEFHGRRRMLKRDCERYNAFVACGWLVVRFSYEHVMFEPDYVRRVLVDVVRVLGRGPLGRALGDRVGDPAA